MFQFHTFIYVYSCEHLCYAFKGDYCNDDDNDDDDDVDELMN